MAVKRSAHSLVQAIKVSFLAGGKCRGDPNPFGSGYVALEFQLAAFRSYRANPGNTKPKAAHQANQLVRGQHKHIAGLSSLLGYLQ
jgi:hypothetical protein